MIKLLLLCVLATLFTMVKQVALSDENITASTATTVTPSKTEITELTNVTSHETSKQPAPETSPHPTSNKATTQTSNLNCSCSVGSQCQSGHCLTNPSEGFCVTMAEENTLDRTGSGREVLSHTCQDNSDLCNTQITITLTNDVYWRSSTTCCNTTNCNYRTISVPQLSPTISYWMCPSCFLLNAASCTPTYRNCVESETKCINVTGIIEKGANSTRFAGQGCATESAKHIKNGTTLVFGNAIYHFTTIVVSEAGQTLGSALFTFLLPSFVGLLQAKFIY